MPSTDTLARPRLSSFLRRTDAGCHGRAARFGVRPSPFGRRGSEISDRRAVRLGAAALFLFLLGRPSAAADKVDVIQLKNGDRLTCEIKKLDRSVLTISTDPLGKASVHWGEISGVTSPRTFDVQVGSGMHYYGSLAASQAGQLEIVQSAGPRATVPLTEVIRLAPIGASLWSRMDGSVDAGFSWAQANLETHYTLNGAVSYRGPKYQFGGSLASQLTTREDANRVLRNSLGLNGNRSLANRWYTIVWSQLQQNEELALDLRALLGGGAGYDLSHTTHRLWSVYSGLVYTHEKFSGESPGQSAEAAVGGQMDFFSPGTEDFKITNSVLSYFAIGRRRVRLELQSAWRHEFLKDFYWSLNGFDSFDGQPPDDRKKNDSGVSFTLGWKF
jgi:Protein of unknown function, DUF481